MIFAEARVDPVSSALPVFVVKLKFPFAEAPKTSVPGPTNWFKSPGVVKVCSTNDGTGPARKSVIPAAGTLIVCIDAIGVAEKLAIGAGAVMLALTFIVAVNEAGTAAVFVACRAASKLALRRTTTMQRLPLMGSNLGIVRRGLLQLVGVIST